jgi:membrane dipeptidase
MAAAAAAAGLFGAPAQARAAAAAGWKPYRNTLSIDGESAVFLLFPDSEEEKDAKKQAVELAAVRASGLGAILISAAPNSRYRFEDAAFERTKKILASFRDKAAEHADVFMIIDKASDLARAQRERRLGVIPRFQCADPIGERLERVKLFRELGVRVIQLTHNPRNLVGDGCVEPGNAGLSRFGHDVVECLNAEKVVVDLAHGSQRTIAEGIKASKAPVLISHTGCRALSDNTRNTTDAELRAMADRGGVAGIIFWPYLRTDTQPMAIDVVRHIEHAINVCGEDHVGLGTDGSLAPIERTPEFEKDNLETSKGLIKGGLIGQKNPEGIYMFITDLNVANRFEVLAGMLSARGHSDARIAKILGGNFARVFAEVWGE